MIKTKINKIFVSKFKMVLYYSISLLLVTMSIHAQNKNKNHSEIIGLIDKISPIPRSVSFKNNLELNNHEGHLQGVQYYEYNQNGYYFLTGSSSSYSYYVVVKVMNKMSVISINKILKKPYKHAGGFQIYNNFMAIGVEDNKNKKISKVFIYPIYNPEDSLKLSPKIIERNGVYKRVTAGCVSIIEIKDYVLVIVGDWDTKHLDFYRIRRENIFKDNYAFKKIYTVDSEKLNKSRWINKNWLNYQNINLFKDSLDNLYLFGMAVNDNNKNVLDLYNVETDGRSWFNLIKIYTREFVRNEEINFNLATGAYMSDKNRLKILSCGANIQETTKIYVFE